MKRIFYFFIFTLIIINYYIIAQINKFIYCSDEKIYINLTEFPKPVDINLININSGETLPIIREYKDNFIEYKLLDYKFCNNPLEIQIINSLSKEILRTIENIYIYKNPEITDQSESIEICKGNDFTLWIDAEGDGITFQWYKDGFAINGANFRIFELKNFNLQNVGTYYCVVSSIYGCNIALSKPIWVNINQGPRFVYLQEGFSWARGINLEMKAVLHTNNQNVKLQWYKDTIDKISKKRKLIKLEDNYKFSGTNTEVLLIRDLIWYDRGNYICVATDDCGSDTARTTIGEDKYFTIYKDSDDFRECEGKNAVFKIRVEQTESGTLEYQWYKTGFKKLTESAKYKGTKTPILTINNVQKEDNNSYYCLVTLREKNYSKRSPFFYIEAKYKPLIVVQPVDYVIKNRENPPSHYGQTYVGVTINNRTMSKFRWFRNDTLVKVDYDISHSNYFIGPKQTVRPAEKTDVGEYYCEITNECGVTYSNKAKVYWGYDDVYICKGGYATLEVDNLNKDTNLYDYKWFKDKKQIKESSKFNGSNTYKLSIYNVNENDFGNYDVFAVNKNTGQEIYLGKIYLVVEIPPKVAKELPDTIYLNNLGILEMHPISFLVKSRTLYYQLYKDDLLYKSNVLVNDNFYSENIFFYVGGKEFDLPEGNYYIKAWTNCGETKSKNFVVRRIINPNYFEEEEPEFITSVDYINNEIDIYPNPASELMIIKFNNLIFGNLDLAIYSLNGIMLYSNNYYLSNYNNEFILNLSNLKLSNNIYFLRIKFNDKLIIKPFIFKKD